MFSNSLFDMFNSLDTTPFDGDDLSTCDLGALEPIPLAEHASSHSDTTGRYSSIFDAVNAVLELTDPEEDLPDYLESSPPSAPWQQQVGRVNMNTYAFQPNIAFPVAGSETNVFTLFGGKLETTPKDNKNSVLETFESKVTPASISAHQSGRWNERFLELRQFRQQYDHCCVPSHWPQNPPLAQWVKRQRYQHKIKKEGQHSTMTEERERLLEELDFVWDSHSAFWQERLNELLAFREKHGHSNVPSKYPENAQLAIWAKCQRRQFKLFCIDGSKRSNMTLERISKLARVGFVFNPREAKRKMG
jgi:hypothetical protein